MARGIRGRDASGLTPELLDLVGDIYQAGLEPEHWSDTIARMSRLFDADMACIYTPFPARPEQAVYLTHNFTREMEEAYSAYYHRIDEWTNHALRQKRYIQGTVALGEEIVPQAELRRTEYYNDFLKLHDMEWMVTTALLDGRAEGAATHMSFTRHRRRGAYDGDGKRLIELLAPHVRRALLTHWRLTEASLGRIAHESALDSLGYGLALLGENGEAVHLDASAECMVRADDGFKLKAGFFLAAHAQEQAALRHLLRQAALGVGGGFCLKRANGKRPYSLTAIPLPKAQRFRALGDARVMLLIHDPEAAKPLDSLRSFAARHRISPAELRVLTLLLADLSPKEIAEHLGVGIRTVRTQLSSLYLKTGTKNQRDLIVSALSGGLPGP